jgi:MFS family permease
MLSPEVSAFLTGWARVAILVAFIAYLAFTVVYGLLYQWKKRRAGRAVFFSYISLIVVSLLSLLTAWVGEDYWLRPLWRAIGLTGVAFAGIYLIYALLRNWNRQEKIEIEPKTGPTKKVGRFDPNQGE